MMSMLPQLKSHFSYQLRNDLVTSCDRDRDGRKYRRTVQQSTQAEQKYEKSDCAQAQASGQANFLEEGTVIYAASDSITDDVTNQTERGYKTKVPRHKFHRQQPVVHEITLLGL